MNLEQLKISFEKSLKQNNLSEFLINAKTNEYGVLDFEYYWRNMIKDKFNEDNNRNFIVQFQQSLHDLIGYQKDPCYGLYLFFIVVGTYLWSLNKDKEIKSDLDLDQFIVLVKKLVIKKNQDFIKDKRFAGYDKKDGMLGVFNHQINVIKNELGGPDFSN